MSILNSKIPIHVGRHFGDENLLCIDYGRLARQGNALYPELKTASCSNSEQKQEGPDLTCRSSPVVIAN